MDGVSVDFEFLGRFALAYEEWGHYHGHVLTKFDIEFGKRDKRSAGGFQCSGTGN